MVHRTWLSGLAVTLAVGSLLAACAGTTKSDKDDDSSSSPTSTGVGGGTGGAGGAQDNCPIDCSSIPTTACQVATCNQQTAQCEVGPKPDGGPCDDGLFCTVSDSCQAGVCVGGGTNDCGTSAQPCQLVSCDEATKTCSTQAATDGTSCQLADLCITGSTCSNGLCIGGTPEDCFLVPVPDVCHVAECNPNNGMCEPVPGNDGVSCTDPNDLCTLGKTCSLGICQGGQPKDCSQLTVGCTLGVCDMASGQCTTQALMNGDPCDDLDGCTTGETCQNSTCSGGTAITQCINSDGCCPTTCSIANDNDCITCATIPGPTFPNTISGWPDSGLQFTSLKTGTLQSFTFNNQSKADTISLLTMNDQLIGTISVAAGSQTALNLTVNWPVQAGVTYRLINAGPDNGRWTNYSSFPVNGTNAVIDGTTNQSKVLHTQYWFTFTNIEVCGT